jgi:hypothetical protein
MNNFDKKRLKEKELLELARFRKLIRLRDDAMLR